MGYGRGVSVMSPMLFKLHSGAIFQENTKEIKININKLRHADDTLGHGSPMLANGQEIKARRAIARTAFMKTKKYVLQSWNRNGVTNNNAAIYVFSMQKLG